MELSDIHFICGIAGAIIVFNIFLFIAIGCLIGWFKKNDKK